MEKKLMKIKSQNQEIEVELLDIFTMGVKQYILYTKNEDMPNDNKVLYVSILKLEGDTKVIEEIVDDQEYQQVLAYLGQLLSEANV